MPIGPTISQYVYTISSYAYTISQYAYTSVLVIRAGVYAYI